MEVSVSFSLLPVFVLCISFSQNQDSNEEKLVEEVTPLRLDPRTAARCSRIKNLIYATFSQAIVRTPSVHLQIQKIVISDWFKGITLRRMHIYTEYMKEPVCAAYANDLSL